MSSRQRGNTRIASAYGRASRARPASPVRDDGPGLDRILERELGRLLEQAGMPPPLPGPLFCTPTPMLPVTPSLLPRSLRLPASFEEAVAEDAPTLPDPRARPPRARHQAPPRPASGSREQLAVTLLAGLALLLALLMQLGGGGASP